MPRRKRSGPAVPSRPKRSCATSSGNLTWGGAGRRLPKLHGAFAAQQLGSGFIHKADPNGVDADLRAPAPDSEYQMSPGIHRRKVGEPDVLKHAQHAEFPLLIDQGVIGNNGEIEVQGSADSDRCDDVVLLDLIHDVHAFVTWPNTVWTLSRCGWGACVIKNWLPPVSLPAWAMESVPVVCLWVFRWVSHLIL